MKKVIATIFYICFLSNISLAEEIKAVTEDWPPFNYEKDGQLVGLSTEIVRVTLNGAGIQADFQIFPWARAYKMAVNDKNVLIYTITRTAEREKQFKWIGPLTTKRDILVARKGSGIKIDSLEDAKKVKSIGTLRDDTREHLLKSLGFTNLEPVSDEQLNAKKLVLGRIDLWTYKIPGLRTVCELAGVDYNEVEEVYHLREINLDIAFSKKTSDSIVQRWRNAFNDMVADGTIMNIRKKWNMKLPEAPFPELEDKL